MFFHIRMVDYPVSRRTDATRDRHRAYLEEHANCIYVRGATHADDLSHILSSVIHIDVPGWAEAREFVANEPNNRAGVYMGVEIHRWGNPLGRRQRDFPRKPGQVLWFVRGYAKPNVEAKRQALHEAHIEYFKPYDAEHFLVRGGTRDEKGVDWTGTALIIALPDRKTVREFLADEPLCKAGLFQSLIIERYGFGGSPGQVV